MQIYEEISPIFIGICVGLGIVLGFYIACIVRLPREIQEVREVDNGYYITINDEIYYKEVENEK